MGQVGGSTTTKHSSSASPTALGQRGNSDPEHIFHCQCLLTSSYSCYSWAQASASVAPLSRAPTPSRLGRTRNGRVNEPSRDGIALATAGLAGTLVWLRQAHGEGALERTRLDALSKCHQ
jgi:hypothetical protein